jgi:hypothetical protein
MTYNRLFHRVVLTGVLSWLSLSQADNFSIIALPDTQIYSHDRPEWRKSSRKEIFTQQTTWVVQNYKERNIKFVLHMGDIVHLPDKPYQWDNANKAMGLLDGIVPTCFAVGNHDFDSCDAARDTSMFNTIFPYSRYDAHPWYGGRMKHDGYAPHDNYDNSYHFFSGGDMDFMVVSLECGPVDAMIDWADNIIKTHPDKRVIVITHSYMNGNNTRDTTTRYLPPSPPANSGENIWQKLIRKHANIFLVLSGHHDNSPTHRGLLTSTGDHGNTVYQLLNGEWYDGWLRIIEFIPSTDKIRIRSYSPWTPVSPDMQWKQYDFSLPGYNTDEYHQYELDYSQR